jgi:hypothetical protein
MLRGWLAMAFDFVWLYFHVAALILVIAREYARPQQRNLFAILISGAFLILVSGQGWWMLSRFEESGDNGVVHLYQYISLSAVRVANLYVGLAVLFFCVVYFLKDKKRRRIQVPPSYKGSPCSISYKSYIFLYAWVFFVAINLSMSAGGLVASFTAPGLNFSYGVTMLLILLSFGKFPLFYKIVSKSKIHSADVVLFVIVIFFTLFNARLNVALILLQLVILHNYCRQEISRKILILIPGLAVIIFIVFGLYREYASRFLGEGISQDLLFDFLSNYKDISIVLDWFYGMNVEGFAGLAGVLTYDATVGGIVHDFGLSNIIFLTHFIPGSLRNDPSLPFSQFSEFLRSIYPYPDGSVVSPGIEISFSNFGVMGVILFGGLLGYISQFSHEVMSKSNSKVNIGIFSVQSLHLIRGTISNALFFGFSDLIMNYFYKIVLSTFNIKNKIKAGGPKNLLEITRK